MKQIAQAKRRLQSILFLLPLEPVELSLAMLSTGWGAWVLGPWECFAYSPSFKFLLQIAPEWFWGLALFGTGLSRFISLLLDYRRVRYVCALIANFLWLTIVAGVICSNPMGTGTPIYSLIALLSTWVYLRLQPRGRDV